METELKVSFAELRQITERIIDLVSEVTNYDKSKITLRTSINNTIGVDGDDWDDILLALQQKENLLLDGLNFYEYFQDEGQIAFGVFNLAFLPIQFLIYILTLRWRFESFKSHFASRNTPKTDLTIADLVTSKLEGKFVKRESRTFRSPSI
ncbi:MAG: hypothetical protein JWQ25_1304 [Daejeonella sp.]|nr:hypothetical protein [Daejeonella sp.]